ncbi:TPM domain-containing protein [Agrococcus jenensis]|uniref:Putative membrane protein YgcG n=1 Tax=Agrococcus jenensis TaxID=46353 RepID=A0A3N2ATT1_9MICO|nr:TPM domain-containing protein [Agrococcus jenensis]ROR66406.1 putative membrane protein YgcG [Agrococcus jenensis]
MQARIVRPFAVVAMGAAGLLALSAGALVAEDPVDVGTDPFVDTTGDYQADDAAVTAQLEEANAASDGDVFVVVVDSYDGIDRGEWSVQSAEASGLGQDDLLVTIAMDDSQWGYGYPQGFPLSEAEVNQIAQESLLPALNNGDVPGGVTGFSTAVGEAIATGGSEGGTEVNIDPWPVVLLVGGAAVVGGGAFLVTRGMRSRRKKQGEVAERKQQQLSLEELKQRADIALVQLDDTVQASEQELAFANAQFGEEAVRPYREALDKAKAGLTEAFALQQQLDDAFPDSDQERHEWSSRILQIANGAGTELASHATSFEQLRDLERTAPQVLESLVQSRQQLDGRIANARQILDRLDDVHAGASIDPVRENIAGAERQLPNIDQSLAAGRDASQQGNGSNAALAVHAAEAALAQASGLLAAVERAERDLGNSRRQLDELVQDSIGDIAAAKTLRSTSTVDLAPLIQHVEEQVRVAQQRPTDTLTVLSNLQRANQRLDEATAQLRQGGGQLQRQQVGLDRWIESARANIDRAEDYIHTRRMGVGPHARQLLATAQQELAQALRLREADPATASQYAQAASQHAEQAMQDASGDVGGWGGRAQNPYYRGGRGGGMGGGRGQDMLTGGLLGYILGDMLNGPGGGIGGHAGGYTDPFGGGGGEGGGGGGGLGDLFSGGGGSFGGGGGGGFFGGGFSGGGGDFGGGGGFFGD